MTSEHLSPSSEEYHAVIEAFEMQIDRCEIVMGSVFHRRGSEAVEMRAWLHGAAPDMLSKADVVHTEPLYLVSMFVGEDEESADFQHKIAVYHKIADEMHWSGR